MDILFFKTIGVRSLELLGEWGYIGAFVWSLLDRVTIVLIPSEILLPIYGFLVGRGIFSFLPIFIVISLGALAGELLLYLIFAKGGRLFLEKYGKYLLVYKHDLDHLDQLFEKHGPALIFWGRLLPVARSIIAIPAGISRLSIKKFVIYSFLGMMPYNFLLIILGEKAGENFEKFRPYFNIAEKIGLIALVLFIIWYIVRHLRNRHSLH